MAAKPIRSFNNALNKLDQASKPEATLKHFKGVWKTMSPKLQGALKEIEEKSAQKLQLVKEKIVESSKDIANKVDQQARKKPWHFVGAASAVSALFAFLLGRKTKK